MKAADVSFGVFLFVETVLVTLAFTAPDIQSRVAFWLLATTWLTYILLTSTYFPTPDQMLDAYTMLDYSETYLSGNLSRIEDQCGKPIYREGHDTARLAPLGGKAVMLFWPVYRGVYMPTTVLLKFSMTHVFTKDNWPCEVRAFVRIQLSADRRQLASAIDILSHGTRMGDKTTIEVWKNGKVPAEGTPENEKTKMIVETYDATSLANILRAELESSFQEATFIAARKFKWNTNADDDNIRGSRQALEQNIIQVLSLPSSIFVRAGFLEPNLEYDKDLESCKGNILGPSAISFDVSIMSVDVVDPDLQKSLNKPAEGMLEGERLRAIEENWGKNGKDIMSLEMAKKINTIKVTSVGESILELIKTWVKTK